MRRSEGLRSAQITTAAGPFLRFVRRRGAFLENSAEEGPKSLARRKRFSRTIRSIPRGGEGEPRGRSRTGNREISKKKGHQIIFSGYKFPFDPVKNKKGRGKGKKKDLKEKSRGGCSGKPHGAPRSERSAIGNQGTRSDAVSSAPSSSWYSYERGFLSWRKEEKRGQYQKGRVRKAARLLQNEHQKVDAAMKFNDGKRSPGSNHQDDRRYLGGAGGQIVPVR